MSDDAVSPMHNPNLLAAPVSESQKQVPALTVNSDVIMPSIEQGFDFSTFLEDETSSNILSDNSMVDPSLDSMDFFCEYYVCASQVYDLKYEQCLTSS